MRDGRNLNNKKSLNNVRRVSDKNVSGNVYICGAANSGKTTLFNGLTGASERTGNWYGVTTDVKAGVFRLKNALVQIYDLPGSYFDDYTLEGKKALNQIKNAHGAIIVLCEAANLQQGLKLYKKAREYSAGKTALVINMYSELKKRGGNINLVELKKTIGSGGVIIAEVNEKAGILAVKRLIDELLFVNKSDKKDKSDRIDKVGKTTEKVLLFDENELLNRVLKPAKSELYGIDKRIFASPILSSIILIAAFFVGAYIAFGEFGLGKALCFLIEKTIYYTVEYPARHLLITFGASEFLTAFFCDGVIKSVCSLITFLPPLLILQIFIFYAEQSGILARIAFLFDELFSCVGLSGRVIFTFLTGYGCTAAAAFCAEGLENERTKNRAILSLPFIPCSAKTPVFLFLLSISGGENAFWLFCAFYVFGLMFSIIFAWVNKKIKKEKPLDLIIEFPPLRIPKLKTLAKALQKFTKSFIIKIGTVVFTVTMSFWLLGAITPEFKLAENLNESILSFLGKSISLIFIPIGITDWQFSLAAFSGLFAKESAVSILIACGVGNLSSLSAFSYLIFYALYSPCFAALSAIKKVSGLKYAVHVFIFQNLIALFSAYSIYFIGTHLKICLFLSPIAALIAVFAFYTINIKTIKTAKTKKRTLNLNFNAKNKKL